MTYSAANPQVDQLRTRVKELLDGERIAGFIGYERASGSNLKRRPCFVMGADLEPLVLDHLCTNGLAKYLMDYGYDEGKMGIAARGCDLLAIKRLAADHRIDRDRVVVIGIPCQGVMDPAKLKAMGINDVAKTEDQGDTFIVTSSDGETREIDKGEALLDRCLDCGHKNPDGHDILLGEETDNTPFQAREFAGVSRIEAMEVSDRYDYWKRQMDRCLRCYACRNVCPACSCRECAFDVASPEWLGARTTLSEQQMFHFTRAMHVAGRCVGCHRCEEVCPVDIPLMELNEKLMKDIEELFAIEGAHVPRDVEPLGQFQMDDPDEFN